MRHRKHIFKVGRSSEHVKSMLANQVSSLILEGHIRTTVTKAKEARRLAERMITLGKKGTLHHRRLAISRIRNKIAVQKLFGEVAPGYTERAGGYTRIIRLGTRGGDSAEMCILEWVEAGAPGKRQETPAAPAAKKAVEEVAPAIVEDEASEDVVAEKEAEDVVAEEEAEEVVAEEAAADDEEEEKKD